MRIGTTLAALLFLSTFPQVITPEFKPINSSPREIQEYHNLKVGDNMPVFSEEEYAPIHFGEWTANEKQGYFIAWGRINVYVPENIKDGQGSFYAPNKHWAYLEEAVDCSGNPFVIADMETKEAYFDLDMDGIIDRVVPILNKDLFDYAPSCE